MAEAANLLRQEKSPYLLQHADNPVHWRPWGEAALREAGEAGKPILLSVGYAACHWCHVMAHESFEDPETAALMNAQFVNVKVDREERPDVDHLYMSALHVLGEQGGWPLTMFLTPAGEPFWGGTYFPPEPRWGRPSFRQVLTGIAATFRSEDGRVAGNVGAIRDAVGQMSATRPGAVPGPAELDRVAATLFRAVDHRLGGLSGAPKFPNPPIFRFFWSEAWRTGRGEYADAVHALLRAMSAGGIYDHLGGGYARYSTDAEWLAPHFEKMLYDNAQILDLLALAQADRPDPLYMARAEETVGWLLRDMTAEAVDGLAAFAASEDADSEGEEGRFYVWTEAEVDAALGTAAPAFKAAYDVTPDGNWEGQVILRRIAGPGDAATEAALARGRAVLFGLRAGRVRPGRDDKVLTDWNGLAVTALARAAAVFRRPDWLARAEAAHAFLRAHMATQDGRIAHAWRGGQVTAAGLLDDQAAHARAALALFEATGRDEYLQQAEAAAEAALAHFADPDGSFYTAAADAADLPAGRPRSANDAAVPSGNGLMAEVFARLHHLTGDPVWRRHAEAVLAAYGGAGPALAGMPTLLAAARLLEEAVTVVVTGEGEAAEALAAVALAAPDPVTCVLRAPHPDSVPFGHPAQGKTGTGMAAYVCRANVCGLPVTEAGALRTTLRTALGAAA